ncbi:hypothetical protein COOONC_12456, partial [Cooperia oncophora]
VDKRGRKLVDYDHAKHNYSSAKLQVQKKGETDPKVAKAYTELQQAETLYKEINNELLEILPATYDSRITFYVDTLQSLFNSQSIYQAECCKLNKQIVTQLDRLGESMDSLRVPRPEPRPSTPTDSKLAAAPPRAERSEKDNGKIEKETLRKEKDTKNPFEEDTDEEHPTVPEEAPPTEHALEGVTKEARKVLYLVKATHEYKAVDTDELSFSPGETLKPDDPYQSHVKCAIEIPLLLEAERPPFVATEYHR